MTQNTTNNRIEEINKIYDYAQKLIEEENKDKEEVIKALVELGVSEQKASTICSNVIYQANLVKERNADSQDNKSVKGWLSFFLLTICVGFSISAIIGFKDFSLSDYEGFGNTSKYIAAFYDLFFYVFMVILGTYTIISFVKIKPNAVFLGKSYLIVLFVSNLILLLVGEYENSYMGGSLQIGESLISGGIWFSYLCLSEQVKDLFPVKKRVIYKRDKLLLASIIVVIASSLLFGFTKAIFDSLSEEETYKTEFVLSENEYSDGRIAFTKPNAFEITESVSQEITFFNLEEVENAISATIVSDYDADDSENNFNDYLDGWTDESLKDFRSTIVDSKKTVLSKNSLYSKTIQYQLEEIILNWTFLMVFDVETKKVCVISYYYIDGDSNKKSNRYLDEIVSSIRFK